MPQRTVWIAALFVSDRTAAKITGKHHVTADQVREAVVCRPRLTGLVDVHPERGLRLVVHVHIDGHRVEVVLYPTRKGLPGSYHLGSAYRL